MLQYRPIGRTGRPISASLNGHIDGIAHHSRRGTTSILVPAVPQVATEYRLPPVLAITSTLFICNNIVEPTQRCIPGRGTLESDAYGTADR
jgi:hypothetical protein